MLDLRRNCKATLKAKEILFYWINLKGARVESWTQLKTDWNSRADEICSTALTRLILDIAENKIVYSQPNKPESNHNLTQKSPLVSRKSEVRWIPPVFEAFGLAVMELLSKIRV